MTIKHLLKRLDCRRGIHTPAPRTVDWSALHVRSQCQRCGCAIRLTRNSTWVADRDAGTGPVRAA